MKLTNTLAFMFETRFRQRVTKYAAELADPAGRLHRLLEGPEEAFQPQAAETQNETRFPQARPRRAAGRGFARSDARGRRVRGGADACGRRSTTGARPSRGCTEIADALEAGRIAHVPFDPKQCAAPLPRAFGWADGSAYVNHVALVRKARGAEVPATFWTDPLMYHGALRQFIGPSDPIKRRPTTPGASTSRPRSR